jgi:hypothetical protein
MTNLPGYRHFTGVNQEMAVLNQALAYAGSPLSEHLLFGISGGVVTGYFTFDFHGVDPQLLILTRYSFDPMQKVVDRLGIPVTVKQTDKPEKATQNLLDALDAGQVPIAYADMHSLPYNNMVGDEMNWAMMPVIVYGLDGETAYLADRAAVGLTATAAELLAARGRVKSNKHRLLLLGAPDIARLPGAVEAGIRTCIDSCFGEPPVQGLRGKFGMVAYDKWITLLTTHKDKLSWSKYFGTVPRLYTGMRYAYQSIEHYGTGGFGARRMYADFLHEAAVILGRPHLREAARAFQATVPLWRRLAHTLLPDSVVPLHDTRRLLDDSAELFRSQGNASLAARQAISTQLDAIQLGIAESWVLDAAGMNHFRETVREAVAALQPVEQTAFETLRDVMI